MRLKNFKIKHNLLDFTLADIQNETFEVTKESLVAYWKFIELSDKINQGNYSINNISAVSDSIAFLTFVTRYFLTNHVMTIFYKFFYLDSDLILISIHQRSIEN